LSYDDEIFTELLGIWVIECYSLYTIDVLTPMGFETRKKLPVFSDTSRQVKCYSSHPLLAYFEEPFNNNFPLTVGNTQFIKLRIRSFSKKPKDV